MHVLHLCIIDLRKMCHFDFSRLFMHRMNVTDTRHKSSPKNPFYGCRISPPFPGGPMEQYKLTKKTELAVPKFAEPEQGFLILDSSHDKDSFDPCAPGHFTSPRL